MSTKQQTTGSNTTAFQFDPTAQAQYGQNIAQVMPWLRQLVSSPFTSDAFKQESTIGQDQAAAVGRRGMSNIMANANALGYGTSGGLFNTLLGNATRNTAGLQAGAFRGAIGSAIGKQMGAAGILSSFQPQMTGSQGKFDQTQTQGGLGTWLPQLAGALGGAAMNAFLPGMGAMGGGAQTLDIGKTSPEMGGSIGFPGMGFPGMKGGNPINLGSGYGYGSGGGGGGFPSPFLFGAGRY